jgi:hypothetical protein
MDELNMIHDFVMTAPKPSERSRKRAREALQTQMAAESRKERSNHSFPVWRLLPTASVAAIFAAVALFMVSLLLRGGQQTTAAAAVLRDAAHIASLRPAHFLQSGEYAYTKSEGAYFDEVSSGSGTWGALVRITREIWVSSDGSGRIRQTSITPVFLAPGDRALWQAAGAHPLSELSNGATYDRQFGPGGLSAPLEIDGFKRNELLGLANNPDALSAAIQAAAKRTENPLGYEMLTIIGDLLSESASPPQLRASLYKVAATIPGIRLVGTLTDRAGRKGTAVAASRDIAQLDLIFDPATSALLAKQETLVHKIPDTTAPVGTVISYTLYLDSGIRRSRPTQ